MFHTTVFSNKCTYSANGHFLCTLDNNIYDDQVSDYAHVNKSNNYIYRFGQKDFDLGKKNGIDHNLYNTRFDSHTNFNKDNTFRFVYF